MNIQRISRLLRSPPFQRLCNASAVAMFLLIVVLGSLPGAREDIGQFASGGVLHSVAYAILGGLTFFGGKGSESRRTVWAVLKVAVMGAVDECVQSLFPYRTAAVTDWLVDVTAAVVISVVRWKLWPTLAKQVQE
jgi:VanZ family protein